MLLSVQDQALGTGICGISERVVELVPMTETDETTGEPSPSGVDESRAAGRLSLYAPQDWPDLLTPTEVADLLRLTRTTVTQWCVRGTIDATQLGGKSWRIPTLAVWPLVPELIRNTWPDGPWKHAASDDRPGEA